MKLHILSDLHIEFAAFTPPETDADVVVLAGDIHLDTQGLQWARTTFPNKPIIYVTGNHEFYKSHWTELLAQLHEKAQELGIYFLEDNVVTLGSVRFLGATMWTDFALFGEDKRAAAEQTSEKAMSDFRAIRASRVGQDLDPISDWNTVTLPASFTRLRHLKSRDWLKQELAKPFEGKTVVISHHSPSMRSVPSRFTEDIVSAAFASHLEALFDGVDLWIHGHTHDSFDYIQDATRIVCNPRGYCSRDGRKCENARFDPAFRVQL